jgi:hypothetical protein
MWWIVIMKGKRGRNSKFTRQQIEMCKKHLQDGKSLRKTAYSLGPDWTPQVVLYYKKKLLVQ